MSLSFLEIASKYNTSCYVSEHENGVYRMMNVNIRKINITRDVKWLNKVYHDPLHRNTDNKSVGLFKKTLDEELINQVMEISEDMMKKIGYQNSED